MTKLIEKLKINTTIKELKRLKDKFLISEDFERWVKNSEKAKLRYKQIHNDTDFKEKGVLINVELDEMFRTMKKLSANRSLSKLFMKKILLTSLIKRSGSYITGMTLYQRE